MISIEEVRYKCGKGTASIAEVLRWAIEEIGGLASSHPSSDSYERKREIIAALEQHAAALAEAAKHHRFTPPAYPDV